VGLNVNVRFNHRNSPRIEYYDVEKVRGATLMSDGIQQCHDITTKSQNHSGVILMALFGLY